MTEVKLPKLPSKVVFLTLLEALLMLNDDTVRIEIEGRYKIEIFQLGVYYQDSLSSKEDLFEHSKGINTVVERLYE